MIEKQHFQNFPVGLSEDEKVPGHRFESVRFSHDKIEFQPAIWALAAFS
jgi:hypothetical protein